MLEHVRWRHKSDKVVYDQRKYDLEKELKYLKQQLNIFHREGIAVGEETDRAQKVYGKFMKQLE